MYYSCPTSLDIEYIVDTLSGKKPLEGVSIESILDGMKAPYAKKLYDAASLRFRENFQAPLIRYNEDNKTKYPCIRFSMVSHHPNHAISCLP